MVEDDTSLVTGEEGFIEIPYEHPRCINGMVDVDKWDQRVGRRDGFGLA